jgi:hypothetical protein
MTHGTIRHSGTRYSATPLTAKWIAYLLEYQCVINKGALLEVRTFQRRAYPAHRPLSNRLAFFKLQSKRGCLRPPWTST